MKRVSHMLSLAALAVVGCSTMDSGVNVAENSTKVAVFPSTDQVHVFVSKNDNTMYRMCGKGYDQPFVLVSGIAPGSVTLASATVFEFDRSQPDVHNTTGQSWHIGQDGNPWRVELRDYIGKGPGWMRYPISGGGPAIDIATTRNWQYGNYNTFVIGSYSTNGSNIYKFDRSTYSWVPYSSNIQATAISCDQYDVLWCVTSSGQIFQEYGSSWVRRDNGSFTAKDIGCGYVNNGIFAVSSDGKLYQYINNSWNWIDPFNRLGKVAKRISVSNYTCAVSTTTGELYYVNTTGNYDYDVKKATNISGVNDVAIEVINY